MFCTPPSHEESKKLIIKYLLCGFVAFFAWVSSLTLVHFSHFSGLSGLGYTSKNGRIPGYYMAESIAHRTISCKMPRFYTFPA